MEPTCNQRPLVEPKMVEARLFTLRRGILPVFPIHTYCRSPFILYHPLVLLLMPFTDCHTRYYPCYSVKDAKNADSKRQFYPGPVPNVIHVTETCYVEKDLIVLFETQMAVQLYAFTMSLSAPLLITYTDHQQLRLLRSTTLP